MLTVIGLVVLAVVAYYAYNHWAAAKAAANQVKSDLKDEFK